MHTEYVYGKGLVCRFPGHVGRVLPPSHQPSPGYDLVEKLQVLALNPDVAFICRRA